MRSRCRCRASSWPCGDRSDPRSAQPPCGVSSSHRTARPTGPLQNARFRRAIDTNGAIAQLVEHLHGMQGVRSSSLLGSTERTQAMPGFFCAQSQGERARNLEQGRQAGNSPMCATLHQLGTARTVLHWYPLLQFLNVHPSTGRTPWQQGTGLPVSGHRHEHTRSDSRPDPQGQAPSRGSARQREQARRPDLLIKAALFVHPSGRLKGRPFFMGECSFPAAGAEPGPGQPEGRRPRSHADDCPVPTGRWWRPHGEDCPDRADA